MPLRFKISTTLLLFPVVIVILFFFGLTQLCASTETWIFSITLTGLIVDVYAAALIVVADISYFDRLWQSENDIQLADSIREAQSALFRQGPLTIDSKDFQKLLNIIENNTSLDINPRSMSPPNPGKTGGSLFIKLNEDKEGRKTGDTTDFVHSELFRQWVENEIRRLREGVKGRIRTGGLVLLLSGFILQSIGYILRFSSFAQTSLLPNFYC